MNRKDRRTLAKESRTLASERKAIFSPIPREEWPPAERPPMAVWANRKYLVQFYVESNADFPDLCRLTICRTTLNPKGGWDDGMTWDELNRIKDELGFGDYYAMEIYPRHSDIVNDANMRHLWMLSQPLSIGWRKS